MKNIISLESFCVSDLKEAWNTTADVLFKSITNKEGKASCLCKIGTHVIPVSFKLKVSELQELTQEERSNLPVFIADDGMPIVSSSNEGGWA